MSRTHLWDQFNRYPGFQSFYAVVDKDGRWQDSAASFNTCVAFAAALTDTSGLYDTREGQIAALHAAGISIVHSSLLKQMWEKGLIK